MPRRILGDDFAPEPRGGYRSASPLNHEVRHLAEDPVNQVLRKIDGL